MHGIWGGNILLCTSIWWLTASAKHCSHPSSQMSFFLCMQTCVCSALERNGCCWWRSLIFPSCFFNCGHCSTKMQLPKLWDKLCCCCWGWEDFLGKWCEQGGKIGEKLLLITELLPCKFTVVAWKFEITYLPQRKSGYTQTKWCR